MTKVLRNVLEGVASIGSVTPTFRRQVLGSLYHPAPSAQDALRKDAMNIGNDFRKVLKAADGTKR